MEGHAYGYLCLAGEGAADAMPWPGVAVEGMFIDSAEGARPAFRRLLARLRPGDAVVLGSIRHLGGSDEEMVANWLLLTREKKAHLILESAPDGANQPEAAQDAAAQHILELVSRWEHQARARAQRRQAEGIAAARQRGVRLGRRPKERGQAFHALREAWRNREVSAREAARRLRIDHKTFLRWAREEDSGAGPR